MKYENHRCFTSHILEHRLQSRTVSKILEFEETKNEISYKANGPDIKR